MKSFTVLTVSRRTGWEELANKSIARQTEHVDNWLIVTRLGETLVKVNGTVIEEPPQTRPSNLNASLNEGLRYVTTDYVIFYQDFIDLQETCFENLLLLADNNTFVTTCTPNYDGSDDGRYTGVNGPRRCKPEEWEANVAIAPMKLIRELGGFDEEYDEGWSWDNCNLAERAAMLGAAFIIDEANRPKLLPHDRPRGLMLNGDRHAQTMEKIRNGIKPIKLRYL